MRFLIFLLATLLLPAFAWAQKKSIHAPEVVEGTKNMFQGPKNSFTITMSDADDKVVEDLWKDLIKNYDSKLKNVRKADVEMAEDIRIQSISGAGTINLYSIIDEQGDDVVLSVWFEMDNGNFLSSAAYPNSYADVEELLQNFGISVKRKMVEIELDEENEMLEDLAKDLEKMVKQKEKLEDDIKDYEKRIEEAKNDITTNVEDQKALMKKIEEQKNQIEMVNKKLGDIN